MSFSSQISKFSDKTSDKMYKVVRNSFEELGNRILRYSPVGDATFWEGPKPKGYTGGRFRANWQASVNRPATGEVESTNSSLASGSITNAAKVKRARSYYLMNNLPYSVRLEEGHSRQAREGIVKLAVAEWESIVKQVTGMVK